MEFEYDAAKSETNRVKHKIDFIDAQELWENEVVEFIVSEIPEMRYFHIGQIRGKFWTAIITYRNDKIRIISVRRAKEKEIAKYEEVK